MAVMSCALGWCVCDLTCFQMMWLVVRWFVVLPQRTTPVLLCTLYYKVLPQYYSVLQSTTPVLLCTTKYYSSTTLQYYNVLLCTTKYYKVLLQYYSVLQSTTPVLQRTTLYYQVLQSTTRSSTTLYYKVLLQYYSVLQSTTPVLLVLQSTTPVLLCTTKYYSGTTLYYTVLRQYYSVLPSTTTYYSVLQSTTTYYSSTTLYYKVLLQYHSVLQSTTPVLQSTTPVLLCTTKYYNVLLQYYSVLKSTTPVLLCTTKYYSSTTLQYYNVLLCTTKYYSSTTLYYKVLLQYYTVLQSTTPVLLCTTKYYSGTTLYYKVLQRTTPVLLCTTKYYSSTTLYASTTLYYASTTTYYSGTTLKRHLQCAAQQESASNFTKYCACHAKWMSSMICVTYETSFPMRGASQVTLQPHQILRLPRNLEAQDFSGYSLNASANRKTIRGYPRIIRRYPRIKSSSRTRRFGDLTRPILETILYCKIQHFALRLSPKMSRSAAPVTKSHPPTSPNTAPATQNECHQWSASHMKPHFQCVEQVKSPSNLTKYCACHAKWMSSMICVTYETSFPMRGATKVTLQPHQILRLPRNLEAQDFIGNSLKCFRQ